ncbi:MAG: bifunctional diaminohydroxyphosphoribosylaminopyrimidine deaminase/5-amino-6-(5-phosphoribosylamino)uracil reductase RibD [Deltaproteobacteria bacterium]|nr:bifunctional diaminohydroxyphosphoribosylaminopyrimidine deaminase/5-amino-6-(5-phosphoribosylamino)uracil reductase RibD [Candidatus Zymogenaceae bacterium]
MNLRFMRRALTLARRFEGRTSPNPPVGAVVVSEGNVVGEGFHRGPGTPHAEVVAIADAGERARGADIYVTLEPCCHHGRTPPCTDAIINAGIGRVFFGMCDPNPCVPGDGAGVLSRVGIEVVCDVMGDEITRFYEAYRRFVVSGLPFVTLKAAMTLDGRLAAAGGDSKWITSIDARRYAHRLRAVSDGILVGVGTVLADDPELTVRLVRGTDPVRVIIDPDARTPITARVLAGGGAAAIIAVDETGNAEMQSRMRALEAAGAEVIGLPRDAGDLMDLSYLLLLLGKRGMMRLLVEGGANVFTYFLKHAIFDKIMFMYAPKILTGDDTLGLTVGPGPRRIADAIKLGGLTVRRAGPDIIVEAYPSVRDGG